LLFKRIEINERKKRMKKYKETIRDKNEKKRLIIAEKEIVKITNYSKKFTKKR